MFWQKKEKNSYFFIWHHFVPFCIILYPYQARMWFEYICVDVNTYLMASYLHNLLSSSERFTTPWIKLNDMWFIKYHTMGHKNYKSFSDAKGCLKKNRNVGHCPKRWEGVQTRSQIFHIVQMGHRGVGGRGSRWQCPKCST